MTTAVDEETLTVSDLPHINLQLGHPTQRLRPTDAVAAAARIVLSRQSPDCLDYGDPAGSQANRDTIAGWLSSFYGPDPGPIPAGRVALTAGASATLATILQVYTDPEYTEAAWLVEPTYFLAFRIFEDHCLGPKLRAVPEDEEGINTEAFEELLRDAEVARRERYSLSGQKPVLFLPIQVQG